MIEFLWHLGLFPIDSSRWNPYVHNSYMYNIGVVSCDDSHRLSGLSVHILYIVPWVWLDCSH